MLTSPLMDMLGAIVIGSAAALRAQADQLGVMTLGIFVTFIYALIRAYEPVKGMGNVYQQFEQAHGAHQASLRVSGAAGGDRGAPGRRVAAAIFARGGIR